MKSVSFIYPIVPNYPIGGLKVIYEYSNYMVNNGYDVTIIYASYFKQTDYSCSRKFKAICKYIYSFYRRIVKCRWMNVDSKIKEIYIWEATPDNIPQSDVYIATSANSAIYLEQLNVDVSKKFYFIQHFETFVMPEDKVIETYKYNLNKIVIANWLKSIIADLGFDSIVVPNGFHFDEYYLTIPINEKKYNQVSMLYHTSKTKDLRTGIKALLIAKEKIPDLEAVMFGVYDKPSDLPSWITYYQNPSHELHLDINNKSAIHVGPSLTEGWGLTIGEAMMCGQAIVCTDNEGYREMAVEGRNALLSPSGNPELLAENIVKLIQDQKLRIMLAQTGYNDIQKFDIRFSSRLFVKALGL